MDREIERIADEIITQRAAFRSSSPSPSNFTSHTAHVSLEGINDAFNPQPGSILDPISPTFDARAWTKDFVRLRDLDPNSAPQRTLGVAFKNLNVFGWTTGAQFQESTGNILLAIAKNLARLISKRSLHGRRVHILYNFEGIIEKGEMLLVLGPPGSGCSTFLKTLSFQTADVEVDSNAYINYQGLESKMIRSSFRGDVLYNAELDNHLGHLSVGNTLEFASRARSVKHIPDGCSRRQFDLINRNVMMAIFGLNHVVDTRVGDDVIRGVSGGERKRVTIAEAALTGAKLQCWDNSTRGLDSTNAITFCQHLRRQADLLDVASAVTIYQAPQAAYDLFDKVTVIYKGRQIFFGRRSEAKAYFEGLGFYCPDRQTVADFLTSMTSPRERLVRPGFEHSVPRTPMDFAQRWFGSKQRLDLIREVAVYEKNHPLQKRMSEYQRSCQLEQARTQRAGSPYIISYVQQVMLTFWRAWHRLLADPGFTIASLLFNLIMALILGSMFYNLKQDTSSFYYRGGIIFFSLMFNAFASQLEVLTIYAERPVVEKQNRYALYHQSAQAIASYLCDLPYKMANMFVFNTIVYFMSHLRRESGAFFFFCLVTLLATLVQSAIFRTLASITRTSDQAMIPSALLGLGLMIYTGFTMPTAYMPGWSRWMGYINPLAYSFEALMANEFHDRLFECAAMVPQGLGYEDLPSMSQICSVVGAEPGSSVVDGDRYINLAFAYSDTNRWRNVGVLCAFMVLFFATYLFAAEYAKPARSRGEVLIFRRGKMPSTISSENMAFETQDPEIHAQEHGGQSVMAEKKEASAEDGAVDANRLSAGTSVFHWEVLCYNIKTKGGTARQILDNIDGWVKPGVATILMVR